MLVGGVQMVFKADAGPGEGNPESSDEVGYSPSGELSLRVEIEPVRALEFSVKQTSLSQTFNQPASNG